MVQDLDNGKDVLLAERLDVLQDAEPWAEFDDEAQGGNGCGAGLAGVFRHAPLEIPLLHVKAGPLFFSELQVRVV